MTTMNPRTEFSDATKVRAWERCHKRCERCGTLLIGKAVRFNHMIPSALGGSSELENCEVLCLGCDHPQTYEHDIPAIAKSRRIRKREAGVRRRRTITQWRRFNGDIVTKPRER